MECYIVCVVFVKEKTSYELRISDWSSDVCSSDRRCAPASAKASGWGPVRPTAVPRRCRRAAAAAPWGSRAMSTLLAGLRPLITLDKVRREFPSGEGTIAVLRSEEHTSELQSLMRISYAVFCLKKKTNTPSLHFKQKQSYLQIPMLQYQHHTRYKT